MNRLLLVLCLSIVSLGVLYATPSTTYWSPCTTYSQPYGVGHLTYDTYAYMGNKTASTPLADLPVDYGFTIGVLPETLSKLFQIEVGFDYLSQGIFSDNLYYNAKVTLPESIYGVGLSAGIFNLGFSPGVNDYNVVHGVAGKTFGNTSLSAGVYKGIGGTSLGVDSTGLMFAGTTYLLDGTTFQLAADYMTGMNSLGGGGVGLYWYFAPGASILVGPVFYNDASLNGQTKWTLQVDLDMNLFK